MQRMFVILWSAVAIILIGLMAMLYVSLIPHFGQIGNIAFIVLCVFLGYVTILGGVKTYSLSGIMLSERIKAKNQERLVSAPADQHSIYLQDPEPRYSIHEVSANVFAASVPRLLPAPSDESPFEPNEQDIINIYNANKTITLKDLAERFDMKYHEVQKIYADAKSHGLITRKP